MPIVLLRMTLSGGQAHGGETGQEGALAVPKTMCSSSRIPLKNPVGQVLTPTPGGVRSDMLGFGVQNKQFPGQGLGLCSQLNDNHPNQ